jgi:adenylate cyclase class IV
MSLEIEKRFKNFDYKEIKEIFKSNNIDKVGGLLFKISNYHGVKEKQFVRVRDEGNKITFTIKQRNNNGYDTEYEVIVNNYEIINSMLLQLKLKKKYDMHKYREIYITQDKKNEIIFDHYPGLEPFMEIESRTEQDLNNLMKLLGLSDESIFTPKDLYYEYYGIRKDREMISLTFDNAKDILEDLITKKKDEFNRIIESQLKKFFK